MKLLMAQEVILRLDEAQDSRPLSLLLSTTSDINSRRGSWVGWSSKRRGKGRLPVSPVSRRETPTHVSSTYGQTAEKEKTSYND
jgi:hypothetical protein